MDSELIEEAERGNREIQARDHRALFAAVERERLVSEAATAILASEGIEPQEDGTYWGENTWPNAVKDAATCLAVFEAAQKPTDDEREALANLIPLDLVHDAGREGFPRNAFEAADRIIASDVWRSRRPVSPSPALGDLENHLGRTSEGTALLPALWALAGVSPEPTAPHCDGCALFEHHHCYHCGKRAGLPHAAFCPNFTDVAPEPQTEPTRNPCEFKSQTEPTDAVRRNDEFTRLDNYTEEPQTELSGIPGQFPTDAQVLAALNGFYPHAQTAHLSDWSVSNREAMRAALRDAAETTNENGSRSDG